MPPERFDALPELFPALSTLRNLHARTHSDSLNSEASAGLPSGGADTTTVQFSREPDNQVSMNAINEPRGTVGILVNPSSGRDVRRLAARAQQQTLETKRNQVSRIAVGVAAAGARKVMVMRDPMRAATAALEPIGVDLEVEALDVGACLRPSDTQEAARQMRARGCGALVVLGGDGTNRVIAEVWPDAPLVPISTGTNNVFPNLVEATMAGAAAGLVASERLALESVARKAKVVRVEAQGRKTLGLIDAVRLEGDHAGNRMPFEPEQLRDIILTRAEPAAIGMSPIGGLLMPCGTNDDFGVHVICTDHAGGGRPLLAPISPGLYRTVHVAEVRKVALDETFEIRGPGVLAFDGDREITLDAQEPVELKIVRDGPQVLDVPLAMRQAAEQGLYLNRGTFKDSHGGAPGCC